MTRIHPSSPRAVTSLVRLACALAVLAALSAWPAAQAPAKKALTVEDYTKWRSIAGQEISGDGRWVTYTLQQMNTVAAESKPVLHLRNLATDEEITVEHATGGTFSPDSKWMAYQVDPGAAQRARAGRAGAQGGSGTTPAPGTPASPPPATPPSTPPPATGPPPTGAQPPAAQGQTGRGGAAAIPPRRVELRNLETGEVRSWQDIGTFTFAPTSTHLFMRRRPAETGAEAGGRGAAPGGPGGGGRGGGGGAAASQGGLDVVLLDLGTGRHQLLGSVNDIAFNRTGELLAYTVESPVKDGNGLFVFDTRSGRTVPLDNDAKQYRRLTWNEDGNAIAVIKGLEVEKMRERDNVLVAFTDIPVLLGRRPSTTDDLEPPAGPSVRAAGGAQAAAGPAVLDPAKTESFPKGWVISERAAMSWSEDNRRVFFGIKEQVPAPDTTRRGTDEVADVDVWNTTDDRIQSAQMTRAEADRNFTFRQAFDVADGRFVRLADETMRDMDVSPDGRWAIGRDMRGYIHDFNRPAADLYRVDTRTGERTLIAKGQTLGSGVFGITPHGRHFLFWKDQKLQAYDLEAGTTRTLGGGASINFTDMEFDRPGPRPAYGIAGHANDGKALVVNHRYDLWLLPLDGTAPKNLTNGAGAKAEMRLRLVRTEPIDETVHRAEGPRGTIDLSKPLTLSAYGEYTKKAGFYELAGGQLKELVYEDAAFSTPAKAAHADRYIFRRETFTEYPDLLVSGPGFRDAKKISSANPHHAEYTWGRRVLFDYRNRDGVRLQGILALPDDYKAGEKRPMIVTFYEKSSQGMHRYSAPSYLTGMGASPVEALSRGYLIMQPDIHFRTGSSHSDMLECVEAATRKVIEMGYADPKRIGVTGHSYGGEGAAFIGVASKMFAAVGMGAGVTDLFNDFSQNWGWAYQYSGGSGANGNDYYLFGQGRWGFSPWDQPDRYRNESALVHAPKAHAPFLIMHGTADPTVHFNNSLGFYNALRYNGKTAHFLAYPGEGHGLRGMANRKDLTIRFFQFFDHYLKGDPAPKWMTDGVPFLKKDESREPK
jgi:dipeptidyl aminopeptidase/acylaminoacyl peptidase